MGEILLNLRFREQYQVERSLRDSRASTDLTQEVVWGRGQSERGRTVLREIGLDKEQSLSPGD